MTEFSQMAGRYGRPFLLVALCMLLAACGSLQEPQQPATAAPPVLERFQFKSAHMGTQFFLTLYTTNLACAETAADAAFRRINTLEETLSDYRADSELNLLREKPVRMPVAVSDDLWRVLNRSRELAAVSGGAFDPTIGPYVRLWRFSRKKGTLPTARELADAKAAMGWSKLLVKPDRKVELLVPGMRLDVGGIAKGFAADEALKVLRRHGITQALVAASGDIALGQPPPGKTGWRIEVSGLGKTQTYLLANCGVSTSGDSEQFVEIDGRRYSHIVDPRTGLGLQHRVQVTVTATNATTTDALATAASVLGVKDGSRLLRRAGAEGRFVWLEGQEFKVLTTSRFPKPAS